MIPGAAKGTQCSAFVVADNALNANRFCGNSKGLATVKSAATDAMSGTVCSKDHTNFVCNYSIQNTYESIIISCYNIG